MKPQMDTDKHRLKTNSFSYPCSSVFICGSFSWFLFFLCVLCASVVITAAERPTPAVVVLADFEDGSTERFSGGKWSDLHPSSGKGCLELTSSAVLTGSLDFSAHDYFHLDVFNPQNRVVTLAVELRDAQTRDYWTRVNQHRLVPPGRSTISLPTRLAVGEKSRPGRPLLRDQVRFMAIMVGDQGPIYLDNMRLERVETSAVSFHGLVALDFGPPGSPVLEGFTQAGEEPYTAQLGRGWVRGSFGMRNVSDALQPEPLTQDFVCPQSGVLRLDVPKGRYTVVLNVDSPGGFWGELPVYRNRQVRANGKMVLDETMDFDRFVARWMQNAHVEDLPGVDPYDRYVLRKFNELRFEVDAADGKIELDFRGGGWALTLTHLVAFPSGEKEKGDRFLAWAHERRRWNFNQYFKPLPQPPTGAPPPAAGYRLFTRHSMKAIYPHDGPAEGEPVGGPLRLTVAPGEEAAMTLCLQPGRDVGTIDLKLSPLVNKSGQALPPGALRPGWLDYRIQRVSADGTVYEIAPRYWHPTPVPAAAGVTRRFWVRVHLPGGTAPGEYRGTLTVLPGKADPTEIPVALTVLPFDLDEVTDVAVGPWGSGIDVPWFGDDPAAQRWNWAMFEKTLHALRDGGFTSFSGRPTLSARAAGGRIELSTERADREMALMRSLGFKHLISAYGANLYPGYPLYSGPSESQARQAGFDSPAAMLRAIYQALDQHAASHDWLPLAVNICDEPATPPDILAAAQVAQMHRQAAQGLTRITFMGATSLTGDKPDDPHRALAAALLMPSLNLHDEASLAVVRSGGNRFSFYNGGNRWTYGRYLRMLVDRHDLALRLSWHCNVVAADPYYALDAREDDYCWFNTDETGALVPSLQYLSQILPGLNDYRYLSTLKRLIQTPRPSPTPDQTRLLAEAQRLYQSMVDLRAGDDRWIAEDRTRRTAFAEYDQERARVAQAIINLMKP